MYKKTRNMLKSVTGNRKVASGQFANRYWRKPRSNCRTIDDGFVYMITFYMKLTVIKIADIIQISKNYDQGEN